MDDETARAFAQSRRYQTKADAANTLRAYAHDWTAFREWCAARSLSSLPADPETVGAYLAQAGEGFSSSTLRRRVAAIARMHRSKNLTFSTTHPAVRETLRGIARDFGAPPKQAEALLTDDVKRLVETCDDDLTGIRDRALLLLCFAGAFRRSELAALDVSDIRTVPGGLRVTIVRSKTDKAGKGATIIIAKGSLAETCPVQSLATWLKQAGIADGPVFRKVDRWGRVHATRLVPDAVRQILLKRAALAGLTGSVMQPITAHGLRAGFVTAAYRNGVPDEEIMEHTRHRNLTTMRGYVRRAKLGSKSASAKIGL